MKYYAIEWTSPRTGSRVHGPPLMKPYHGDRYCGYTQQPVSLIEAVARSISLNKGSANKKFAPDHRAIEIFPRDKICLMQGISLTFQPKEETCENERSGEGAGCA